MQIQLNARNIVLQHLPKNGVGVEIGVHLGEFSGQVLRQADPRKLFLIDPYRHVGGEAYRSAWYGGKIPGQDEMDQRYAKVCRRFRAQIEKGRVEIVRETSLEAVARFADESLDYVYVDGDHTFDAVLADIRAYLPKLKIGGLLIGDDYSLGGWWGGGVVDAFHQCLHELPLRIEFVMDTQICCRRLPED